MPRPTPPDAEITALKGLAFLAGLPAEFERFLSLSGVTVDDARVMAETPQFLAGLLDFILGADLLLLAFCDAESLTPRDVHLARARLTGENGQQA